MTNTHPPARRGEEKQFSSSAPSRLARQQRTAPDPREALADEIAELCTQIDRRLGNRRGTAERGIYFWLYPRGARLACEVLAALHADALAYLHDITTTPAVLTTATDERNRP